MQSGYGGGGGGGGGVSDLQQFLVQDGGAVFSLSTNSTSPSATAVAAATAPFSSHPFISYHHHHHPLLHLHHHHHQPPQPQPPPPPPLSSHFGMPFLPVPVSGPPPPPPPPPPAAAATQQLFYQEHDFRLFHPHPPSPPPHAENHSGGSGDTGPSLLSAAAVNFKLAVDGSGGPEEESAMKELSWRPLDIDFIHSSSSNNNNKRQKSSCSDHHDEPEPLSKYGEKRGGNADNYKLFSELEAIYKPGSSSTTTTPTAATTVNQTGSGSALTGDDYPIIAAADAADAAGDEVPDDVGGTSETSAGEDTPAGRNSNSQRAGITARKKRRWQRRQKRKQQQLETMVGFMEEMVKRLMDHQESLHRSFLEAVERRDRERSRSDESWREQAAARSSQEAAARAGDRALADARDAALISFLENISGDRIHLPEEEDEEDKANRDVTPAKTDATAEYSTSRWPRTEVEALIAVRSGLEPKFQEPGLKGPLWEEVSARMAALGFRRSSKRCKEKWENINKYFRKAKESGKARPLQSKTCPYFYHLDILYSKSADRPPPPQTTTTTTTTTADNSELLDSIVVSKDHHHIGFKFHDNELERDQEEEEEEEEEEGEDPNCNKDRIVENNNNNNNK